jgi:hypothetical protein
MLLRRHQSNNRRKRVGLISSITDKSGLLPVFWRIFLCLEAASVSNRITIPEHPLFKPHEIAIRDKDEKQKLEQKSLG